MLGNFGDKREGQSKNDTRGTSHSAAETREIGSSSSFGEKPQSPASLDAFVTATSAEAVSLVIRQAGGGTVRAEGSVKCFQTYPQLGDGPGARLANPVLSQRGRP